MSSNTTTAGVENKVVAGGTASWASGVLTWVLVTYVFHGSLPADLATFLPALVASVLGPVAAYFAKHTPRLEEVAAEVAQVIGVPAHLQAGNLTAVEATAAMPASAAPPAGM